MPEKNNGIKQVSDLDKTKVQAAIDKFGADKVNQTLTDRGVEGAKAPTDTIKEPTPTEGVKSEDKSQITTDLTSGEVITPPEVKVTEPKITEPKIEEVKVEEPKIEEKPLEIKTLGEFKTAGSNVDNLANFLENSPTTTTEDVQVVGNKVTGIRDGERFEWIIDSAGNPIRKSLGIVDNEKETFAKNAGISFDIDQKGGITFNPSNFDEALDIINQFGTSAKFKEGSREAITASAVFKKYSKYKGATSDIYLEGLKSNEIATGGETWNRLIKMNGGEPTTAMLMASAEYETSIKTDSINNNSLELYKSFGGETTVTSTTKAEENSTTLEKLDKDYLDTKVNMFENIETMYSTYKAGTEETNNLRKLSQDTASQIDELNVEKRRILDNVKKRNPNLPLSTQLKIARDETEAVDDELFALQRTYSNQMADYQYADTQDKAEFEFNMSMLDQKNQLIDTLYGTTRTDIIRQEDITRQDKLLEESITRAEEARKQAIKDGDVAAAKDQSYKLAYLEKQNELNKKAFQGFSTSGGLMVFNPNTGEVEFKPADGTEGVTPTSFIQTGTGTVTQNYGATSPVTRDNVKLADGTTGTPGIDIDGQIGDIISSFSDGKVIALQEANESGGFGRRIVIEDTDGNQHVYNHLNASAVHVGDEVKRGQTIAEMGNTGTVVKGEGGDGSHLDYRVSDNGSFALRGGNWIDPNQFMGTTEAIADTDFVTDRLARNTAIDLFLGADTIDKTTKTKLGADVGLVSEMGTKIEQFRQDNIDLVRKFEEVTGESSKTSDKEQVKNFNRAIGESALGDGDLSPLKNQIRQAILGDKAIFDELAPALDVQEQITVIQDLFSDLDVDTGLTTAAGNAIAKRVGDEIGDGTLTRIDQLTGKMLAAYVKSISGVAVSEPEYVRLSAQLPQLKDNPKRFTNMLESFRGSTVKSGTIRARTKLNDIDLFNELFPEFKLGTTPTGTSFRSKTISTTPTNTDFDEFIK